MQHGDYYMQEISLSKTYFFCIITVSELYRIVVFFRFIAYSGCISLHSPFFMTRQQIVKRNTWKVRLRKRRRKLLAKCCVQNKLRGWKKGCTWAGQLEPFLLLSLIAQIFKILNNPMKMVTFYFSIFISKENVKTILRCHYKLYLLPTGIISLKSLHWYAPCWETFTR